ncbi:hypothetical protein Nmel_013644 [Mimus melanotis]
MAGEQLQLPPVSRRSPRRSHRGRPASALGAAPGRQIGPGALWAPGLRRAASGAAERGCRRSGSNGAGLPSPARAAPSPCGSGAALDRGQREPGAAPRPRGPRCLPAGLLFAG